MAGIDCRARAVLALAFALLGAGARATEVPGPREALTTLHDFRFASGETLPEVRLRYLTFGAPHKDSHGHVNNAVLILHGTGQSAASLVNERFSGELFRPGGLLDARKYYLVLPDGIGHGDSSKPSDGLHARFPAYGYRDMVKAQYQLITGELQIGHLRLVLGGSMGCMHTFLWATTYPDSMDALMALACLPAAVAGRNRVWRETVIQGIRQDPEYQNGEYRTEPYAGLRLAAGMLLLAGSAPIQMQLALPTRAAADEFVNRYMTQQTAVLDANDLLYQLGAASDYDPSPDLEKIKAPLVLINFADDFSAPPELGIAEREIKRVRGGQFVLLPASEQTRGHGTYGWASVWSSYLAQLLAQSKTADNL